MYQFGVGAAFCTWNDKTSSELATLQNTSIDFSFDKKELYGRGQFPVKVARGKGKIDGKSSFAEIHTRTLANMLDGEISVGALQVAEPVAAEVSTEGITIPVPDSGKFNSLLSLYDVTNPDEKKEMLYVPNGGDLKAGEYTVNGDGKITFATGESAKNVLYQYDYQLTGKGQTIKLLNKQMGTAPTFEAEFYTTLDGHQICFKLNRCTSEKLTLDFKNEDFVIPDFTWSAFADSAGVVGMIYLVD